ncbi:hypothetical protein ACFL0D_02515 [Thermoproteota archaeon]
MPAASSFRLHPLLLDVALDDLHKLVVDVPKPPLARALTNHLDWRETIGASIITIGFHNYLDRIPELKLWNQIIKSQYVPIIVLLEDETFGEF